MKKLILSTILTLGTAAGLLAQGTVTFESATSTGSITEVNGSGPSPAAGTYQVALLWAAGTSPVAQGSLTQLAVFTGNFQGYISDATTISTGVATTGGTPAIFEVQGWTGNFASYAAAVAGGAAFVGETAEFVNNTGNPNPPATAPVNTTGWNGNLILVATPEPGTIALGGLGAAALLLFRRRK
jgi:hypothetical protein